MSASWLARPAVRRVLTIACTAGAFAYLFSIVDVRELWTALRTVSFAAWLSALALCATSIGCGVARWWLLFRAFGAPRPPAFSELVRHYMTGLFYNTYLPGGVSGVGDGGAAARRRGGNPAGAGDGTGAIGGVARRWVARKL